MNSTTSERGTLIGVADGLNVYVTARLEEVNGSAYNTVDHDPAPMAALRLSIQGEAWRPRARRDPDMCGQIVDLVRMINPELADLWDAWHLNDMNAACAHMTLPEDKSYDARMHITCPVTGYKYGSAWLYKPLPADIAEQLAACGVPVDRA